MGPGSASSQTQPSHKQSKGKAKETLPSQPLTGAKNPASPHPEKTSRPSCTYFFEIKPMRPKSSSAYCKITTTGQWSPPTAKDDLRADESAWYRSENGYMYPLHARPQLRLVKFCEASLFVQQQAGNVLAVGIDATEEDVARSIRGPSWRPICFHHHQRTSTNEWYSYVDFEASHCQTAARMPDHIAGELIPCANNASPNSRVNAGLIGRLSILIGLAVLSAPQDRLRDVLTLCIRPGKWRSHGLTGGFGKSSALLFDLVTHEILIKAVTEAHRGTVVKVFRDMDNPVGSSQSDLDNLVRGHRGAFYGP